MRPTARRLAPVVAALAVLSPLLRSPTDDTYPLSTYPMFANDRGRIHSIATAVELEEGGSVVRLSPEAIAGTDEVVLAGVTVSRAVARDEADELCEEIVERVGDARRIVVRTERLDVVDHVVEGAAAADVTVHAECGGSR